MQHEKLNRDAFNSRVKNVNSEIDKLKEDVFAVNTLPSGLAYAISYIVEGVFRVDLKATDIMFAQIPVTDLTAKDLLAYATLNRDIEEWNEGKLNVFPIPKDVNAIERFKKAAQLQQFKPTEDENYKV